MKNYPIFFSLLSIFILTSCGASKKMKKPQAAGDRGGVEIERNDRGKTVGTKNVSPDDVINFAETLIGIKYKYGAESIEDGFDCSGFVNYVFAHFGITVPRVTTGFTNAGEQVSIRDSKPGDIILFTGTNARNRAAGHVGIITENSKGNIKFIHASTSRGVMISGMNSYFLPRFLKVNRVIPMVP